MVIAVFSDDGADIPSAFIKQQSSCFDLVSKDVHNDIFQEKM